MFRLVVIESFDLTKSYKQILAVDTYANKRLTLTLQSKYPIELGDILSLNEGGLFWTSSSIGSIRFVEIAPLTMKLK